MFILIVTDRRGNAHLIASAAAAAGLLALQRDKGGRIVEVKTQ